MMLDAVTGITVLVTNPESPFGGVVIEFPGEIPIQIEFNQLIPGPPGPQGPAGQPGPPAEIPEGGGGGGGFAQSGLTPLINGQSFISVAFSSVQPDNTWTLAECVILNTVDASALVICPGTITAKNESGFTIQLSSAPDSGNYSLQWGIMAAPVVSGPATSYLLSGPNGGFSGVPSTAFTVQIPSGQTLPVPVTVTPHDGGGGSFSPATILLTTGSPSGVFTYTPGSTGTKTISTTNDGGLTDPASLSYNSTAYSTTYLLSGPTSGVISVASTNFTVQLPTGGSLASPVTVTPHDGGGGGAFTPTTVSLSTGTPSATFTYTPASSGAKTISTINSSTLTNPASLTYTVSSGAIPPNSVTSATLKMWIDCAQEIWTDGASVSVMHGHAGFGNDCGQGTVAHQPIFKTGIINGQSIIRFDGVDDSLTASVAVTAQPDTVFLFARLSPTAAVFAFDESTGSANRQYMTCQAAGNISFYAGTDIPEPAGTDHRGAFHLFKLIYNGASSSVSVDGVQVVAGNAGANGMNIPIFGAGNGASLPCACDIAEICVFSGLLSSGDLSGLNTYFHNKYGIP